MGDPLTDGERRFTRAAERGLTPVTGSGEHVADRFRAILSRRHFVDHEPGVLLVWLPGGRSELAELAAKVESRHPGVRIAVLEAGAAVAVRMAGREDELTALGRLYLEATM